MTDIEFRSHSDVELINFTGSDDMVAMAAWVSNGTNDEERLQDRDKVAGLIRFLYNNRHMSPFEHGQFTFKITCPIFVAREFHRHRTMSYNEYSGRYSEMKPHFYRPDEERPLIQEGKIGSYTFVPGDEEQFGELEYVIEQNCFDAWERYQYLKTEHGIANEVARMVLPVNIFTEFYATVSPRNLMQFLDLRTDPQALHEIREVADKMAEIFEEKMPLTAGVWKKSKEPLQGEKNVETEVSLAEEGYPRLRMRKTLIEPRPWTQKLVQNDGTDIPAEYQYEFRIYESENSDHVLSYIPLYSYWEGQPEQAYIRQHETEAWEKYGDFKDSQTHETVVTDVWVDINGAVV